MLCLWISFRIMRAVRSLHWLAGIEYIVCDWLKFDTFCLCVKVLRVMGAHTYHTTTLGLLEDISCSTGHCSQRVPGEIKRSRDLRGGRWSWTLNFAQKRSWVGRWRWAEQVGRLLLRVVQVVRQQRCNGHCLGDSVQHSSWKSNCTVHKSPGNGEGTPPEHFHCSGGGPRSLRSFSGGFRGRAFHSLVPFPLCPRP